MTDEERYRIIGYAVSNHVEAKKILAPLLVKAHALAQTLRDVASELEGGSGVLAITHPIAEWPTASDLQVLFGDISAMLQEIAEIELELRGLGISS